ncbi:MAG TPA: bifunctional adenosylcobinamide kinase/adenosylcobinamide-phosphate guanylyltransferase [Mycobacterium sp.]|nr:MAG: bifunctional adenosylcobinamide kinase/adenosylcobinamide-phosphate guanylyltransferase [Mycobacterium sp.]HOB49174.1 bifunctional adenosylcobinamide kinase/adenosylcobinamide-phosphate guanylyltransferase [Mycobacterium sp.]HPZ96370.1 bifunctional adenosylcobinamide kinase/adenosylcobinamide-phosphate guanylyltransferase [Mycobacterium sp.]HQE14298.1 bifunctional adenosylcobinamide kinase/adenosylcobinamide-phosphate guanylyltransferase [Mycobacterium sp.]
MRTLVLGGMRSGKSSWAEAALACTSGVRYVATGPGTDSDSSWAERIAEHRRRRPPEWTTVETADVAGELRATPDAPTLVDDLGGWLTGLLDRRGWDGAPVGPEADDLAEAVGAFAAPLVLVSPEVGLSVVPATSAGRRFADELGRLNQRIAAVCDRVVLVVAGQPMQVKG